MSNVDVSIADIVKALGGELIGSPDLKVCRIRSLGSATASDISFLSAAKYAGELKVTKAGCVILSPQQLDAASQLSQCKNFIVTSDPYLYFARLTQWWKRLISWDCHITKHVSLKAKRTCWNMSMT